VFGNLTGLDPRTLGENECSGFELGMSPSQMSALQQVAFEQLESEGRVTATPQPPTQPGGPRACQ
jgi:hypothetical protein